MNHKHFCDSVKRNEGLHYKIDICVVIGGLMKGRRDNVYILELGQMRVLKLNKWY